MHQQKISFANLGVIWFMILNSGNLGQFREKWPNSVRALQLDILNSNTQILLQFVMAFGEQIEKDVLLCELEKSEK